MKRKKAEREKLAEKEEEMVADENFFKKNEEKVDEKEKSCMKNLFGEVG